MTLQLYVASTIPVPPRAQHAFQVSLWDVDTTTRLATTTLLATFGSPAPAWLTVTLPLNHSRFTTGGYTVAVEKRTEAIYGVISLYRAVVTARGTGSCTCAQALFDSAAQPDVPVVGTAMTNQGTTRRIEFIGDSITTGYGVYGHGLRQALYHIPAIAANDKSADFFSYPVWASGVEGTGKCYSSPSTENVLEFYGVQAANALGTHLQGVVITDE